MENKTGKYIKYAFGEIILVMIGILLALQVNNWNENRKIEDIKQNYYQQLLVDLEKDKKYAEDMISVLDSLIAKHNNYRKTIEQPFINFDTTFKAMSTNSFNTLNLEFKTSSIKSLLNTGDIKLLEPNLRDKLSQYNASKSQALNLSKSNNEATNSILQNAMMAGGSAYFKLKSQPELITFLDIERKLPETFIKLEAYLTWKIFGEKSTIQQFKELIEDIDILIDLVDKELEK